MYNRRGIRRIRNAVIIIISFSINFEFINITKMNCNGWKIGEREGDKYARMHARTHARTHTLLN